MRFAELLAGELPMIELVPAEFDDAAFVSLVQSIVNGAAAALQVREVYLVHVDNWFDHKWLGWWGRNTDELRVPPFSPNRVQSEKHYVWDEDHAQWTSAATERPIHSPDPGRRWIAQPIDRLSKSAALIWYSGNTVTNTAGSMMLYRSGAEGYAWYASFKKDTSWEIDEGRAITRRALKTFEESGRRMEPVQA
jgi:hypothetical protein